MTAIKTELRHATSIAIAGAGVLIEGPSGAGKSDLALRLIDRGARLVCDDYTCITREAAHLIAAPAPNIAGKLEIFGLGIHAIPFIDAAKVELVETLAETIERFPEDGACVTILGVDVPCVQLSAAQISTPIKVEHMLARLVQS